MYRSATDHLALTHKSDGVVSYHHLLPFLTIASLWLTTSIASVVADQQIYIIVGPHFQQFFDLDKRKA